MNINPKIWRAITILTALLIIIITILLCIGSYKENTKTKKQKLEKETLLLDLEDLKFNRDENFILTENEQTTTKIILTTKNTIIPSTTTTTTTIQNTTQETTTTTTTSEFKNPTTVTTANINLENLPSQNVYNITNAERDMLASLLYLEGGSTSYKCQKMIMEVVFNHYEYRNRTSSLTDIVYTKNMFSPAGLISSTQAQQVQYDIVDEICRDGVTILPSYVLYFRASYHHSWAIPYTNIDNVYFSYSN